MPSPEESAQKDLREADSGIGYGAGTPEHTRRLLIALSEKFSAPAVDLAQLTLSLGDLDVLPREVAARHGVLPLLVKDDAIFLGMALPSNKQAIEEVEFVSGKRVFPCVTDPELLAATIDHAYTAWEKGETMLVGERAGVRASALPASPEGPSKATPVVPTVEHSPRPPPIPPTMRSKRPTMQSGVTDPPPSSPLVHPPPLPRRPLTPPAEPVVTPAVAAQSPPTVTESAVVAVGPSPSTDVHTVSPMQIPPTRVPPPSVPTIPASAEAQGNESAPARETGATGVETSRRRVLLVDANANARGSLRKALEAAGWTVTEAPGAEAAQTAIARGGYDMAVIDPALPEQHGLELCRRWKDDPKLAEMALVVTSDEYHGWRYQADLEAAFGVQAVIEKSVGVDDAVRAIDAVRVGRTAEDEALGATADEALSAGMQAYQRGELDAAIGHLERGVEAAPESFRIRYQLALLVGRRGELFRAIRELERSVAIHGRFFAALKNLAVLYEKAGLRRKAAEAWERSLDSAPDEATRTQIHERLLTLL